MTLDSETSALLTWWPLLLVLVAALIFIFMRGYRLFGIVYVPDNRMGIVSKFFVLSGENKSLPDGKIVALNGEAGYQADTLAPGLYFWFWPWQYSIEIAVFTIVPPGQVGVVESRDGVPIPMGRVLGRHVECDGFQNARAFLTGGGRRGPQMDIIPPGTYRINTALFEVKLTEALLVPENKVCIITTFEGEPLPSGEIAGKEVKGHNLFQDADAFVTRGGYKGLQEQVMMAGTYYTNPRFLKPKFIDLTPVPIGHAGVVVAFVGETGVDTSGAEFTHGSIVSKGQKGVWATPLDPGRYPINAFTHKVEIVPTTNIVLNWATGKTESHKLDEKLSTIEVRSADGFAFNLDVSQIVHVSRENAPKVIARFGSMSNLVTQVLEPTIGNYFRNSAQQSDVIDFLKGRAQRQAEAGEHIRQALDKYNVQAVDTLIGDIHPPEALMKTLTDRKVAEQSKVTFAIQQQAEEQRQEFQRAKSEADTRSQIVAASRAAEVAKLSADAVVNAARGEADAKKIIAEGQATYTKVTGEADASKTKMVGEAEAGVLKLKVESVGPQFYAAMNIFDRLAENKTALVPQIVAGVGTGEKAGGGSGSGIIDALLGVVLAQQIRGQNLQNAEDKILTGMAVALSSSDPTLEPVSGRTS
jgi:uncharacterized membrane protein YqiK